MTKAKMAASKPGQFTGYWEVVVRFSGAVCATGCSKSEATNLVENYERSGGLYSIRRERVPIPPDIIALDMGDDD